MFRMTRPTNGAPRILTIVRKDDGTSDVTFTWGRKQWTVKKQVPSAALLHAAKRVSCGNPITGNRIVEPVGDEIEFWGRDTRFLEYDLASVGGDKDFNNTEVGMFQVDMLGLIRYLETGLEYANTVSLFVGDDERESLNSQALS